jgi:hypothetical protein
MALYLMTASPDCSLAELFCPSATLLLEPSLSLEEEFAELSLDLSLRELDEFEAISFPLDEDASSQSSHTLEEESSEGWDAKSLSPSPQAVSRASSAKKLNNMERDNTCFTVFLLKTPI